MQECIEKLSQKIEENLDKEIDIMRQALFLDIQSSI